MIGKPNRQSGPQVAERRPFLRLPPFPGRRVERLSQVSEVSAQVDAGELVAILRNARVGGNFWRPQPELPDGRDLVLAPTTARQAAEMYARAVDQRVADRAIFMAVSAIDLPADLPRLPPDGDPWHVAEQAATVWVDANGELALVAALLGRELLTFGEGRFSCLTEGKDPARTLSEAVASELLGRTTYLDPFNGTHCDVRTIIALLADWRKLIDSNRRTAAIFGVAGWKRSTVNALLWDGGEMPPYRSASKARIDAIPRGGAALVWKARARAGLDGALEQQGIAVGEIEDGFIRSTGLGANCVPPLSIVVDRLGAHFDPGRPSELEDILQNAEIDAALIERAAALRQRLVRSGLSKYGIGGGALTRPGGQRRHVLVTGQVEDDRSMIQGGNGVTNLELLRRARQLEPDAYLIYKPHPDVEAGHRKGRIPEADARALADRIERSAPIAALLDSVDAVQVITSLTGFEGLMRGKQVTVHGVPFFAGWGLTNDLGRVPVRRTRKRSLDEMVAAVLILYPRYLDPVTRLPCPVETLVDRMVAGDAAVITPLVRLRQAQGRVQTLARRIGGLGR